MRDCKNCGQNNWAWKCEKGFMQGTCRGCGEKTNRFRADGRHKKKEKS